MPKLFYITEGHYSLAKIKKIVKAIEKKESINGLVHVKELSDMEQMVYNDPPLTPFQDALTRGIITTMQDNLDYRKAQFTKLANSVQFVKDFSTDFGRTERRKASFNFISFILLSPVILSMFIWRSLQILLH